MIVKNLCKYNNLKLIIRMNNMRKSELPVVQYFLSKNSDQSLIRPAAQSLRQDAENAKTKKKKKTYKSDQKGKSKKNV